MRPCVVPAIVAMTTTPIAQRDTDSVTRSHTASQRSSSPGISMLASARFRLPMSVSRKRQMKRIVNAARKMLKKLPAMPSIALMASGTDAAIVSAPAWTFSAAPESPSGVELLGVPQTLHRRRQVLEVVPHPADERHEQAAGRAR